MTLQACHYGLLTHPRIVADQRQHYNMARSMAVLSLSFIILVTPWTMKEVAVSCIGSKVRYSSLACSLSFFLQGISYWNASNKSLKGQSISKANYGVFINSFKKPTKNHYPEYILKKDGQNTQDRIFLEELRKLTITCFRIFSTFWRQIEIDL